jgi:A/G-specific adenine glycosylase
MRRIPLDALHPAPEKVHRLLLGWYAAHKREFPWRGTRSPYDILIAEFMLQQTQVQRAAERLPAFLREFPDFRSLASATRGSLVRAWRGMGYNSRAVRLHELARVVMERHRGRLPPGHGDLLALPGIGPYTASAIRCFAFGNNVPVVDINVRRTLSRIFTPLEDCREMRSEREVWDLALRILPRDGYSWNQALMDLGATLCRRRKPRCTECPVSTVCSSRSLEFSPPRASPLRKEPLYRGIPRRLWRGRVVEILRDADRQAPLTLISLGRRLGPGFRPEELPWLETLVEGLAGDGIVVKRGTGRRARVALWEEM